MQVNEDHIKAVRFVLQENNNLNIRCFMADSYGKTGYIEYIFTTGGSVVFSDNTT